MIFAAPAAAEMEVTLSGYAKAEFWGANQDDETDRPRGYNFGIDDSEFHIKAKNTADNGLRYGVTFELEMGADIGLDEGYLWFSGDDWGTIQLGGNEGPITSMPYSGDFSLTAAGGYDGGLGAVYNFANSIVAPDPAADVGDAPSIHYYSPRFSGFQIGLSYTVDGDQPVANDDAEKSDDGSWEDMFEIGVNFVDTINGIDIGIGGAYTNGSVETTGGAATDEEDPSSIHIGFNVGMSGFSFGASYGDNFDTGCAKTTAGCDGGQFYEVAGGYATGPWAVGVGWFHGEKDISTGSDEETDIISITGSYSLVPGASIYSEIDFISEDNDTTDNDGTVYMIGTKVAF
jgi:predicted porin